MRAIYYFYFITLASSPASASLSDALQMEETNSKAEGPSTPHPQLHQLKTFFQNLPRNQEVTLYDDKTNAYYSWTAFWHSTLIKPDCLKLDDEDYTLSIQLIDDSGLHSSKSHEQFASYRAQVTRNIDQVDVSSFYGLFYLKSPKPAKRLLTTDAPTLPADKIVPFLKPGLSSGSIKLQSPHDPSIEYRWEFRWHTAPSDNFLQTHPQIHYSYHVGLLDDRGLEKRYAPYNFASYALWFKNKETQQNVYPIVQFYLMSPQRL